jgi:hypothetical protein
MTFIKSFSFNFEQKKEAFITRMMFFFSFSQHLEITFCCFIRIVASCITITNLTQLTNNGIINKKKYA